MTCRGRLGFVNLLEFLTLLAFVGLPAFLCFRAFVGLRASLWLGAFVGLLLVRVERPRVDRGLSTRDQGDEQARFHGASRACRLHSGSPRASPTRDSGHTCD